MFTATFLESVPALQVCELAALPSASQGVTDESFVYTSPRGRRQGDKSSLQEQSTGRGILSVLLIQESDRERNGVKQRHDRMLAVPYFALRR